MRYLVLSDIHSNLEALEAVLARRGAEYDAVLVLGDLVGYGADPNAVVERVRALQPAASCAATTTKWRPVSMTPKTSIRWRGGGALDARRADAVRPSSICATCRPARHRRRRYRDLSWLAARRRSLRRRRPRCRTVHRRCERPLCLFGHTHVALVRERWTAAAARDRARRGIQSSRRSSMAMRSTCQSGLGRTATRRRRARGIRHRGHRTGRSSRCYRVAYPIETAQKKILEAGLPPCWRIDWGWDGRIGSA